MVSSRETTSPSSTFVAYLVGFYLIGISLSLAGSLLPGLRERLDVGIGEIGVVFTAQAIGALVGSVAAGPLYDRLPGHRVVLAGLVLTIASWLGVDASTSLPAIAASFAAVGFAVSLINVGLNTLIVWRGGAHVARSMAMLHLSFAIGALSGPYLVIAGYDLAVIIGTALLTGLGIAATPSPQRPASLDAQQVRSPVPSTGRMVLASFFSMIVAMEVVASGWLATYGESQGFSPAVAAGLTTTFWAGYVVGRIITVALASTVTPRAMIIAAIGLAGVASTGMVIAGVVTPVLWGAAALAGVSLAPMFPQMLSFIGRRVPMTGSMTSWMISGAGLGGLVVPWLTGRWIGVSGPSALSWSMLILTGCIAAALAGSARVLRGRSESSAT